MDVSLNECRAVLNLHFGHPAQPAVVLGAEHDAQWRYRHRARILIAGEGIGRDPPQ